MGAFGNTHAFDFGDGVDFEMIACVEPTMGSSGMWQYGGLVCKTNACVVVHVVLSENAQTKKTFEKNEKLHIAVKKAIFDPVRKCLIAERVHVVASKEANTNCATSTTPVTQKAQIKRTRQAL